MITMKDKFGLEEYKNLVESQQKYGDRCFRIIVFCFTAFGVIIGFSKYIPNHFVPLLMLAVLWICIVIYRKSHYMLRISIVYIIKKYEKKIESIDYQKQKYKIDKFIAKQEFVHKWKLTKVSRVFFSDPFFILTIATIICYIIFGIEFLTITFCKPGFFNIVYVLISIIGITSIFWNIYITNSRGLEYYLKMYKKYKKSAVN